MTNSSNGPAGGMPDLPNSGSQSSVQNLAKGFHQIYISEIVALITVILIIVALIGTLITVLVGVSGNLRITDLLAVLLGGSGILIIGCIVTAIVSLVFSFMGMWSCAKDDPRYKTLFWIGIACLLLNSFSNFKILGISLAWIVNLAQLCVSLFCLMYSVEAVEAHGPAYLAEKGRKLINVFGIICGLVAAAAVLGMLGLGLLQSIASLAASVLGIYYVISVMSFYKNASNELA